MSDNEDCVHNYVRVLCHFGELVIESVDQGNGSKLTAAGGC